MGGAAWDPPAAGETSHGRPPFGQTPGGSAGHGYLARLGDVDLIDLVTRPDLPAAFERWQLTLAAGAERPTGPGEWAGALVLVEQGRLEVHCHAGGRRTFDPGDLLVLGWLPLRRLRNPGGRAVRLVAVRRRDDRPTHGLLRVIRYIRP